MIENIVCSYIININKVTQLFYIIILNQFISDNEFQWTVCFQFEAYENLYLHSFKFFCSIFVA